ncbi:hypothetical protein [Algoriphagus chordae]|uniref:Glycosyl transferase family 1 n=1 Tax=Algoriphagus chordae TaxID=237019 RepID=A0A2W7QGS5_9BACT|nr:hypothetical protein [Algoriphagus chordae]PZX47664.1 hypothetical protein LV85_03854 [Algoriphagus chordae]
MTEIELLNIPNYYSSFYVLGLSRAFKLKFVVKPDFEEFHNRGYVIFKVGGKLGVIDNHDPVGVNEVLYQQADLYFATNKLRDHESYMQEKVRPIFPHYLVNILPLYFKLFGFNLLRFLKPRDLAKEIYVLKSQYAYKQEAQKSSFGNYVFFSGSTWKKESWANTIRAEFIRACKAHSKIEFEGGLIPRSDGDNFGFDQELNKGKYPPKKFAKLSAKSLVNLNNPAVLGAVSWRLAEYWNNSSFVLSFPFAVELPIVPRHGENIHYLENTEEYSELLDQVINSREYHQKIARGGKIFFDKYCTPEAQANYIVSELLSSSN